MLLGGYAAKTCPRATHNRFDDTVKRPEWTPDPAAQERMDDGRTFEDAVVTALQIAMPAAADLRPLDGDKAGHVETTLQHLAAGTRLIIGGRLPDDVAGGRTGKPDLLIRGEDRADGTPAFHVADIKHHLATERSAGAVVLVSTPGAPELAAAVERDGAQTRWREDDCLQLAHYWRQLEACGYAAEQPWGAVLGTDGPKGYVPDPLTFVWHDLAAPMFWTFSRSKGGAWRSSLERYDHEHGFRLDVAAVARRRTGAADDPAPLVVPIGQRGCESCE